VLGSETAAGAGRGFVLRGGREGEEEENEGKVVGDGRSEGNWSFQCGWPVYGVESALLVALSTQFFRGRYVILENLFQGRVSFYFLFICALPVNFLYSF
jgi:hypothetical protein